MDRDNRLYCEYFSVVFIFKLRAMKDKEREKYKELVEHMKSMGIDSPFMEDKETQDRLESELAALQGEQESKVRITKVVCPDCKNEEGIKYNAFTNTHTCKCGKRWLAFTKQPIEGEQEEKCYPEKFVEWMLFEEGNDFYADNTNKKFYTYLYDKKGDEYLGKPRSLKQMFTYWQTEVSNG